MQYVALDEPAAGAAPEAAVATGGVACFHCGEPVPAGVDLNVKVNARLQPVCCRGCQAVAEWIEGSGLNRFYEHRTDASPRPDVENAAASKWGCYDQPEVSSTLLTRDGEMAEINLWVDGMRCAACAWLVEKSLQQFPAVQSADVNAVTGAMSLRWRIGQTPLSALLARIESLGYTPYPSGAGYDRTPARSARRLLLQRLFVAGVGMGQVMTFAIALYIGEAQAMQRLYQDYFKWISFLITIPVVFYSAIPFFQGAWNGLRYGRFNIDIPVSLAVAGAFVLSSWNTFKGTGAVYFDSVVMFVFFILLGRYLQSYIRSRMGKIFHMLAATENRIVSRLRDGAEEFITARQIRVGDRLRIRADEAFPVDGSITDGTALVDESLLTGESTPVRKNPGADVVGGSINLGPGVDMRATAVGAATLAANIRKLAWQAQTRKPEFLASLDRISSGFVFAVLMLSLVSGLVWWRLDPQRVVDITLAIMIAACPCALALAVPAVLTAASGRLAAAGIWLVRSEALETLARVDCVVFDKTGTLTSGQTSIEGFMLRRSGISREQVLEYAAALEKHSRHPYAAAFLRAARGNVEATGVRQYAHRGLSGEIGGTSYRIGTREFVTGNGASDFDEPAQSAGEVWLGDEQGLLASFRIGDPLREDALAVVDRLRGLGLRLEILSGDHPSRVRQIAERLGIKRYFSRQSSADKMERIRRLQAEGRKVLMIGDGANDTPVLAAADVSIAINGGSAVAQSTADLLLTGRKLAPLLDALAVARRARGIIRQNIVWSLLYNTCVLPLAVSGMLLPWAAAIGMPASSLLVILNALRIAESGSESNSGNYSLVRGVRRCKEPFLM